MSAHLAYLLAWIAFGLSHSGLAGRDLGGRWSRIVYNVIAVAAFLALERDEDGLNRKGIPKGSPF